MPGYQDRKLTSRLRGIADQVEGLMRDLNSIVDNLSPDTDTGGQPRLMSRTLRLAHRDLMSAQAFVFRTLLAQSGVLQRLLWASLGRRLASSERILEMSTGVGSVALDPYRRHLADSAVEAERLFKTLSALRGCMAESEIEREGDIPERPDSVLTFAGDMVDGAIENLEETKNLLYGAAELTQARLNHLWAQRIAGTEPADEGSHP